MLSKTGDWVSVNGKLVRKEKAVISAFDRGYLYGDNLIETMRVYFLKVPFLKDHFERLESSMKYMGFSHTIGFERFCEIVNGVVLKNMRHSCSVRFSISRGVGGEIAFGSGQGFVPQTLCFIRHISSSLEQICGKGIKVCLSGPERGGEGIVFYKTNAYAHAVVERHRSRSQGFDDVLFFDSSGGLCESSTSNVFIVKNGCLLTPGTNFPVLAGVMRSKIIQVAQKQGLECYQARVEKQSLLDADEVFLTNSVAEVVPVVEIEGTLVGAGVPGKLTRQLHLGILKLVEGEIS